MAIITNAQAKGKRQSACQRGECNEYEVSAIHKKRRTLDVHNPDKPLVVTASAAEVDCQSISTPHQEGRKSLLSAISHLLLPRGLKSNLAAKESILTD